LKIATYNVNGVNGRLEILLQWLEEASPDVVCLQELKAPQEKFPMKAIEAAGYGAVWQGQKSWNGVALLTKGQQPHLTRKGLPGEPEDEHSRYIEAIVDGIVIGGLYLPNGNPYPGPKFEYKLRWFKRLQDYAAELLELEVPVILVGDYNVMPTELDVYKPGALDKRRPVQGRGPRGVQVARRSRVDGRAPASASGRAHLHVLGLLPKRLRS
jgi:exodeoxyribonuclease-3